MLSGPGPRMLPEPRSSVEATVSDDSGLKCQADADGDGCAAGSNLHLGFEDTTPVPMQVHGCSPCRQ